MGIKLETGMKKFGDRNGQAVIERKRIYVAIYPTFVFNFIDFI